MFIHYLSISSVRFERDKARKLTQWRRILNAESQLAMCKNKLIDLESDCTREQEIETYYRGDR
jgi:hypothetical protein